MRSISGTSIGPKKIVPHIECSTYPIFGETGQLQIKKGRVQKGTQK